MKTDSNLHSHHRRLHNDKNSKIKKRKKKKMSVFQDSRESCTFRKVWDNPFAAKMLLKSSSEVMEKYIAIPFRYEFVKIGKVVTGSERNNYVFTLIFNGEVRNKTPIVVIHGFGGMAFNWINLANYFHENDRRPVYIFDVLGFNQSSRPCFLKYPSSLASSLASSSSWGSQQRITNCHSLFRPADLKSGALKVEMEFVNSIEAWRSALKLKKMILVGHSFGGYLASSYATMHSNRIVHLVLVDPWGLVRHSKFVEFCSNKIELPCNPFFFYRMLPPRILSEDADPIEKCFYYSLMLNPTGEEAFRKLFCSRQSVRNPIGERIVRCIPDSIPITFIYGEKSWIKKSPSIEIQKARKNVHITLVEKAGHVINQDNPDALFKIIKNISIHEDNKKND